MEGKKRTLYTCLLYSLAAYAAISFLWVCLIATGISNGSTAISVFAERLVLADLAIAVFSAILGFSSLIFNAKKLSGTAKRAIHITLCYIGAMLCVLALFSGVKDAELSGWLILVFFATLVYFAIYGVIMLIRALINKKNS